MLHLRCSLLYINVLIEKSLQNIHDDAIFIKLNMKKRCALILRKGVSSNLKAHL